MSLHRIAADAVKKLTKEAGGLEFSDEQLADVQAVIEKALAGAVDVSSRAYQEATVMCCGPDADLAHKINEEAEKRTELLISNLSQDR